MKGRARGSRGNGGRGPAACVRWRGATSRPPSSGPTISCRATWCRGWPRGRRAGSAWTDAAPRSRTLPPTTTTTGASGGTSAGSGGPRAGRRSACSTAGCTRPTARRRARRSSSPWWTRWARARCSVSATSGTRDRVLAAGEAGGTVRSPERFEVVAARDADTVRLRVGVTDAQATRMAAAGLSRYFLQMRGRWRLEGRIGGEAVADSGVGFFETFVGGERAGGRAKAGEVTRTRLGGSHRLSLPLPPSPALLALS